MFHSFNNPKVKGRTGYIAQTIRNEDLNYTNWTHTKKGWQTYCVRKTRTRIEFVSCHFASALNRVKAEMSVLEVRQRKLLSWRVKLGRGRDPCKHEIYNSKEFNGAPLGSQWKFHKNTRWQTGGPEPNLSWDWSIIVETSADLGVGALGKE